MSTGDRRVVRHRRRKGGRVAGWASGWPFERRWCLAAGDDAVGTYAPSVAVYPPMVASCPSDDSLGKRCHDRLSMRAATGRADKWRQAASFILQLRFIGPAMQAESTLSPTSAACCKASATQKPRENDSFKLGVLGHQSACGQLLQKLTVTTSRRHISGRYHVRQ